MEIFNVHILGCGSALPTLLHSASCQVVEIRGKFFMVDCGECAQIQLRKSHVNFMKIDAILISHLHGDHCFGLIGLISTFGMLGRTAPLYIYAPKEYENLFKAQMNFFCKGLTFDVVFNGVDTTANTVIYDDRSLTIESIPLDHRISCCGFLFKEKQTLAHIKRDMIDFYNIPHYKINAIKQGEDWVTEDGEVVPNARLTFPADPARSYAYCSDTKYLPELHKMIKDVTLLYHESTYANEHADYGEKYFHSTAEQAAMVARDANAKQLLLGHYSSRYTNETILLDEAKKVFPNSILSNEGMIVSIK